MLWHFKEEMFLKFKKIKITWIDQSNYKVCWKTSDSEAAFAETEMNNEKKNFYSKESICHSTHIPLSFLLIKAPLKLLFLYGVKLHYCISFNVLVTGPVTWFGHRDITYGVYLDRNRLAVPIPLHFYNWFEFRLSFF